MTSSVGTTLGSAEVETADSSFLLEPQLARTSDWAAEVNGTQAVEQGYVCFTGRKQCEAEVGHGSVWFRITPVYFHNNFCFGGF